MIFKTLTMIKNILAIETSCDETSVAIVQNGNKVLSNLISSQIKVHQNYGGVVPEIASRMHVEKMNLLIEKAFLESKLTLNDIQAVAVTYGPGLEGSLLVGVVAAKTIAALKKISLIGVNHLHGHIYANFLLPKPPKFPFIALIVSGGHTQLVLVQKHFQFKVLGSTRDDAAGESFDKIARFLELGYPGGPIIEKKAHIGSDKAFKFPQAMKKIGYEFSFSGLKTAVIQEITRLKKEKISFKIEDVCASFQKAVIDILILKAIKACQDHHINQLVLCGGVTANQTLRNAFEKSCSEVGIQCFVPPLDFCTDNAGMIGAAAHYMYKTKKGINSNIKVNPNLEI